MPDDTISTPVPPGSFLNHDEVLVLLRRLVITALLAGVGYSVFSSGSQAYCPGGFSADGGFVDRFGIPTDVAPSCIDLILSPSPVVYLVLGLIVVGAVSRAVQRAEDQTAALRILGWAGPTVIVAAIVAVAVTQASFSSIPLESWDGSGMPSIPAWLAVDVTISPMQST